MYVVGVDLGERAIPPSIEGATPVDPVVGSGSLEHVVGNRNEAVRILSLRRERLCRECQNDDCEREKNLSSVK